MLIYNTKLVRQNPPERWADLLDAGWRGRIAFADPTVSGSRCTALGTLLQAVGGNTDNTLSAFFRNLDGRIIADSGGVVPAVADGSCYVGVTLEENARKAIAASGCTIMTESQWLDPKTGFNTVNSSWMWAMIQTTDTVLNNLLSWSAHMATEAIWGYGYGAQPGISVFSYNRISSGDFRKKSFVGADRSFDAIAPYTTLTEEEIATIAPYASFKLHAANGEKRNYSTGNVTSIPMMRVEEMYLIEAEATAHYDAATGKSLLQSFMANRDPAYTVPAANDLIDEIIFQKRIEFWVEGVIFYDLKRLNIGMHTGDTGTNAPPMAQLSTDGRAPWWNCVFPLNAVQQNKALAGKNNPNPPQTVKSVK